MIHDWTYARFPDREHGEWFGYLHRDGRLSSPIKGNTFKGAFHVPRMELVCWKLMEEIKQRQPTNSAELPPSAAASHVTRGSPQAATAMPPITMDGIPASFRRR
jgi:hypothetical protein